MGRSSRAPRIFINIKADEAFIFGDNYKVVCEHGQTVGHDQIWKHRKACDSGSWVAACHWCEQQSALGEGHLCTNYSGNLLWKPKETFITDGFGKRLNWNRKINDERDEFRDGMNEVWLGKRVRNRYGASEGVVKEVSRSRHGRILVDVEFESGNLAGITKRLRMAQLTLLERDEVRAENPYSQA
jgi:hypothetical protein